MNIPRELYVEPADYDLSSIQYNSRGIEVFTTLFRTSARFETILDLGIGSYLSQPQPGPLTVVSAGASIGTEAYSILAYVNAVAPEVGRVSLTAIDINPYALNAGDKASYRTDAPLLRSEEKPDDLDETLPPLKFAIMPDPEREGEYLIDATKLKEDNDIEFRVGDLRDPELEIPPANIVFCNNLLYHLSEQEAWQVILNIRESLLVGGLVSIGSYYRQELLDHILRLNYYYSGWLAEITEKLTQLDTVPVLHDVENKAPFAFTKIK